MSKNRRRRGFSLIELLIVIAIILILAMIAVPKVNQQLMSARETAAIQEIKTLHQAETQYYSTFSRYATTLAELGPPASGAAGPAAGVLTEKYASVATPPVGPTSAIVIPARLASTRSRACSRAGSAERSPRSRRR